MSETYLPAARRVVALIRDRRLQLDAWAAGEVEHGNALCDRNPDLARYNREYVASVADPEALVRVIAEILAEEAGKVRDAQDHARAREDFDALWDALICPEADA